MSSVWGQCLHHPSLYVSQKIPLVFRGNHLRVQVFTRQISGFCLCLQVSNKYLHWWRTPLVGHPWAV